MPLKIDKDFAPAVKATGANIRKIEIEPDSERFIVFVEYGELDTNDKFKRRTDMGRSTYVFEEKEYRTLMQAVALPSEKLVDVIHRLAWKQLTDTGRESGTVR